MTDSFLAMVVDRVDGCIEFQPRVVAIGYEPGSGPVLVTGASGGVGSVALNLRIRTGGVTGRTVVKVS